MTLTVRPARPDDTPVVLNFIRELADYERMLDMVKITLANVDTMLFCANPRAFCEIADVNDEAVGFALWFYSVSTFEGHHGIYLEDLYVRPAARGIGAGKALLATLARRCRDEGLARLEWAVLDWNTAAIGFYDSLGAISKTDWITRKLTGAPLAALADA